MHADAGRLSTFRTHSSNKENQWAWIFMVCARHNMPWVRFMIPSPLFDTLIEFEMHVIHCQTPIAI